MTQLPAPVADFLASRRIAVAGVSRNSNEAANHVFRKLAGAGYDVVPVNPAAAEVEGVACFADLAAIPGEVDGVVVATPPAAALDLVRQCAARGIRRIWFHRSFGTGSVAAAAVDEARSRGLDPIVGGCPLMFVAPVDLAHRCMRSWLAFRGRVPR